MRFYESIFIARPDMTQAQVESLAEQYTSVIRKSGGDVTKTEVCGPRPFAYPIKKHKKGYYVLLNVKANPEIVEEIERRMRINEDVLRYLTVQVKELNPNPSPLMQQRSFKDEKFYQPDDSELLDKEALAHA